MLTYDGRHYHKKLLLIFSTIDIDNQYVTLMIIVFHCCLFM